MNGFLSVLNLYLRILNLVFNKKNENKTEPKFNLGKRVRVPNLRSNHPKDVDYLEKSLTVKDIQELIKLHKLRDNK